MAALHYLAIERNLKLSNLTIGVIGAGNVGSKVAKLCEFIGMNVLVNDPPRQRKEGVEGFVPVNEIQQKADIITFHTPLTHEGPDKTFHLFNDEFLKDCKDGLIFINSSRGEVMDTQVVKKGLKSGKISEAIIDCWENEPEIDRELLHDAFITTPHIAGYSKDGKANGTSMSVQAISRKFNLGIDNWQCKNVELPDHTTIEIDGKNKTTQQIIAEAVLFTYPIWSDSEKLKKSPETFEKQRGDYPVRREFPVFTVKLKNVDDHLAELVHRIGFNVKE
jgi:erythronate-4-phosphate dehydrogenase